ncbi:MAG: hypothetical protein H0V89_01335, partial [Deltaproteobacteria bacterium]|nr:hypothetical protein [Deltaproteobacteria bacterium]
MLPAVDGGRAERVRAVSALVLTAATTTWIHLAMWSRLEFSGAALGRSFAFAVTLLGILAVHELGHRAAAARSGIRMTLPLFLPAPVLFGTFG